MELYDKIITLEEEFKLWQEKLKPVREYRLELAQLNRYYGYCWWNKKLICINFHHLQFSDFEGVLNTLRHEIAHAMVPFKQHNKEWKLWAILVGATPERCSRWDTNGHTPPNVKWYCICPECKHKYHWFRKPKHEVFGCGKCKCKLPLYLQKS
jgi:predicted SprT family Zn-dependent metalloprotease